MFKWSLCSELCEWLFAVETGWLSRFSTFFSREHVCFKQQGGFFLTNIHVSADVDVSNGCFSQFDSYPWFLLALTFALWETVSISLYPCKHPLCPSHAIVYLQSFIKYKLPRWTLSYISSFALEIKSSNSGFLGIKSCMLWDDTAEKYQRTWYFTYKSQWISFKIYVKLMNP